MVLPATSLSSSMMQRELVLEELVGQVLGTGKETVPVFSSKRAVALETKNSLAHPKLSAEVNIEIKKETQLIGILIEELSELP